ncbi:MAG TPA: zinc-ribbon domain-containing protein [Pyrinomonadaceae bacterium]|jgi:hypothetical protein|nr:zinc-ribbon domain-containing protein [Pyrinomonadaceae bacterium]
MSEPEIARRCPTCGASIRDVAFFCPQCGRDLSQPGGKHPQNQVHHGTTEPLHQNTAPLNDTLAEPRKEPQKAPQKSGPTARGAVGAKVQRATTLVRDVEGDVVQRVKNVRKISSVVLDEAGYDPSLRFVLVAAILFILFLVIVLLNKFIT